VPRCGRGVGSVAEGASPDSQARCVQHSLRTFAVSSSSVDGQLENTHLFLLCPRMWSRPPRWPRTRKSHVVRWRRRRSQVVRLWRRRRMSQAVMVRRSRPWRRRLTAPTAAQPGSESSVLHVRSHVQRLISSFVDVTGGWGADSSIPNCTCNTAFRHHTDLILQTQS
jgi:hypothetical protein